MTSRHLRCLLTVVTILSTGIPTLADAHKVPYLKHGKEGGHYCPFADWFCINRISPAGLTAQEEAEDWGEIDVQILPGSKLHLSLHRSVGFVSVGDSLFPVDSEMAQSPLDSDFALSLGYQSITLVEGNYPVDVSQNPFGDSTIDVILGAFVGVPENDLSGSLSLAVFNNPMMHGAPARIAFTLPHVGRVGLHVYNVTGALVATLVDGEADAGQHVASWDGNTAGGSKTTPGVYFLRLVAGRASARTTLVVLE